MSVQMIGLLGNVSDVVNLVLDIAFDSPERVGIQLRKQRQELARSRA